MRGLKMNVKKTKSMVVSRKENRPSLGIIVDGKILEQVNSFKYLGVTIADDGKCEAEIRKRIEIARQRFINMKDVLTTRSLRIETRKRIMKCYVLSTFLYASETWTFSKEMWNKIEAFEMWMFRKILKVPYTAHVTNDEIIKRVKENGRTLKKNIITRKLQYFGHMIRSDRMQKTLIEGKVKEKRQRGRPRRTWLTDIKEWTGANIGKCVRWAADREYWREMTANLPAVVATPR